MFEDYNICPYTGLRSFTEEESLYFKGREDHIQQATEQLQRNKFLMLTGASGDGKSSLVYAGIVPNARAGFLKSKYTQWAIADFRPERSPFKNLCRALAKQLHIANASTVESELQHGFSALVDLYKNSNCYIDVDSVAWQQADEKQKVTLKRNAANLIIIVDQFEEFFTNPENYRQGVPSGDSNLVLNVLLETARIALEEDLPIYIIFTMRSDFIGQCAAFRSLPEYIGFSQFFVPRLNRTQLQQVIEEPATLSGNRITRRLTERLIHDISEGVDQLPILQHALNQIWHAASQGTEEMDLIHYAMVGGMSAHELPDDQVTKFKQWFSKQPDTSKLFYQEPNLQNVLDTHANKLYESAAEQVRIKTSKVLSRETTKEVIRTTFVCLTKIDEGRAVRNRMTLREIHSILNKPEIDITTLGQILTIFREPGNTFIRPFITDDAETQNLAEDTVLDITHESLIRNWEYLEQWAKQEFDHYNTFLDFEQQLNRWIDSGQSSGFLLSIGPLTYFENWYSTVKPNAWWIARYLEDQKSQDKKLTKGQQLLADSQEFFKRSAARHKVTRAVVRYGTGKMVAVLGIIVLLVCSSFALRNYVRKQNDYVLKDIRQEVIHLINSRKVNVQNQGMLLVDALKDGLISVKDIPAHANDQLTAIKTTSILVTYLVTQGKNEPHTTLRQAMTAVDSLYEAYDIKNSSVRVVEKILMEAATYQHTLELAALYKPSDKIAEFKKKQAFRCAQYVMHVLTEQPQGFDDMNNLHRVLEHAINANAFTTDELRKLINIISPFENANRSPWLLQQYHRDNLMGRGLFNYAFNFNGLYQELAYAYAALGEMPKAVQAIDSLLKYNRGYYQNNYTENMDNASNVAGVFFTSGHADQVDAFVKAYCSRKGIEVSEFYERLLARTSPNIYISSNNDPTLVQYSNGNLQYAPIDMIGFFSKRLRLSIEQTNSSPDMKNMSLALAYKNEGLLKAKKLELSNASIAEADELYQKAMALYEKVSPAFLQQPITIIGQWQTDVSAVSVSYLFTYPDIRTKFHPLEIRNANLASTSPSFLNYLVRNDLINKLYTSAVDALAFQDYLLPTFLTTGENPVYYIRRVPAYADLAALEAVVSENTFLRTADLSLLYVYLCERAFNEGNKEDFLRWAPNVTTNQVINVAGAEAPIFRSYASVVTGLIHYDRPADANHLISQMKNPINRSSLYAFASNNFLLNNKNVDKVDALLDSSNAEMKRATDLKAGQPNRILIAYSLVLQNQEKNLMEAYATIKNLKYKSAPIQLIGRSLAVRGELFEAVQNIPADASDDDKAMMLLEILYGYRYHEDDTGWEVYNRNYLWYTLNPINYVNE
jgi:energy-coupling factor transporter ATP-binding protein EcfA2